MSKLNGYGMGGMGAADPGVYDSNGNITSLDSIFGTTTASSTPDNSTSWLPSLTDVFKGYTQIELAKQNAKIAQATGQNPNAVSVSPQYRVGTTPASSSLSSMMPVIAIGGAALLLLLFAMKKD
jgi:hypothetical protein